MRLLLISIGCILFVGFILMFVNLWGLSNVYTKFETAYFQKNEFSVAIPWEQAFATEEHPEFILWADVYENNKGELLLKPWVERHLASPQLEQNANPTRPLLSDKLKEFADKKTRWILNITNNKIDIDQKLADIVSILPQDQVIIQSDHNIVLTSVKAKKPMWLYGSGQADMMRFRTFQSMHILPATPFKGDLFFFSREDADKNHVTEQVITELKRREKRIFAGPLTSSDEVIWAKGLGVSGVLVNDPVWYLRMTDPQIN